MANLDAARQWAAASAAERARIRRMTPAQVAALNSIYPARPPVPGYQFTPSGQLAMQQQVTRQLAPIMARPTQRIDVGAMPTHWANRSPGSYRPAAAPAYPQPGPLIAGRYADGSTPASRLAARDGISADKVKYASGVEAIAPVQVVAARPAPPAAVQAAQQFVQRQAGQPAARAVAARPAQPVAPAIGGAGMDQFRHPGFAGQPGLPLNFPGRNVPVTGRMDSGEAPQMQAGITSALPPQPGDDDYNPFGATTEPPMFRPLTGPNAYAYAPMPYVPRPTIAAPAIVAPPATNSNAKAKPKPKVRTYRTGVLARLLGRRR